MGGRYIIKIIFRKKRSFDIRSSGNVVKLVDPGEKFNIRSQGERFDANMIVIWRLKLNPIY